MRSCLAVLFVSMILSSFASAQEAALWRGVEFGMTSAAVIEKAGKPRNVKTDEASFKLALPTVARERSDLRKLTYEKSDGWEKIVLSFLDDKLIGVHLWPRNKTMEAASLPEKFGSDFLLVEAFAKGVDLGTFEGQKETSVPKVYPAIYNMLAVRRDRFVIGLINNGSLKAIFKDGFKKPTIRMFPGYVESVIIVSRFAETK